MKLDFESFAIAMLLLIFGVTLFMRIITLEEVGEEFETSVTKSITGEEKVIKCGYKQWIVEPHLEE